MRDSHGGETCTPSGSQKSKWENQLLSNNDLTNSGAHARNEMSCLEVISENILGAVAC